MKVSPVWHPKPLWIFWVGWWTVGIFFAIYSQLEHSFHTWPSDASRIESDLMSRWMTPCECRYAIAFRHCLQTVAICSSSSLQKKKCESCFILNAHRPTYMQNGVKSYIKQPKSIIYKKNMPCSSSLNSKF